VIPALTLPTHSSASYLGDSSVEAAPELAVGYRLGRLRLGGNFGYRSRSSAAVANLEVKDELFVRAGAGVQITRGLEWGLTTSLATGADEAFATSNRSHAELFTGPTYQFARPFQAIAGAGVGLLEGYGTPDARFVVAVRYHVPERLERISLEPVAAPSPEPAPAPAGPAAPVDSDGDQIADADDRCPREAEDRDGFEDTDGCPDPDNDGDRIADASDRCPAEAGPAENRGCPDTDEDHDGVVYRLDVCPAETGAARYEGCKTRHRVSLKGGELTVLEPVFFRTDRATFRHRSQPVLDDIARVLIAHPEFRVQVEGHTDDEGEAVYNEDLSRRRAATVIAYLVKKGVPADRLEPVGYGQGRPAHENKTEDGRAGNRRVGFTILSVYGIPVERGGR
jgi:outer membrane protein OmpA-like peptidoglycan-associated protein